MRNCQNCRSQLENDIYCPMCRIWYPRSFDQYKEGQPPIMSIDQEVVKLQERMDKLEFLVDSLIAAREEE